MRLIRGALRTQVSVVWLPESLLREILLSCDVLLLVGETDRKVTALFTSRTDLLVPI